MSSEFSLQWDCDRIQQMQHQLSQTQGEAKMQDIWYGDKRDRVKWSALVHLARAQQLSKIIQVAFYRAGKEYELEPDTGIAPQVATLAHVKFQDIQKIWEALETNDWLAMYQHAFRDQGWLTLRREKFRRACGVEDVRTFQARGIAKDVAVFAAQKKHT
jgi:hypothetical protein